MSDEAPLIVTRENGIARLVLNRPQAGNAINLPLAKALMEAAIVCDEDPAIRCVVITGAGKLFCAGGDVRAFVAAGDAVPNHIKELTGYLHLAVSRLARMRKPLITAVNGPAAGAGMSLALLGDIALASRTADFTLAYGRLGFCPDGGATWLLPRLVGLRRTQELILMNPKLSAAEALEMGLITRVCEPDGPDATVEPGITLARSDNRLSAQTDAVARQLANSATQAWGRTRALLLRSHGASLESHLEAESRAITDCARSHEGREGLRAWQAREAPQFNPHLTPLA